MPTSKSCDAKTKPNVKNPVGSNLDIMPSLRIIGQLPARIVNGEGDSFRKWRKLKKLFVNGRTYAHTYRQTFEIFAIAPPADIQWRRTINSGE